LRQPPFCFSPLRRKIFRRKWEIGRPRRCFARHWQIIPGFLETVYNFTFFLPLFSTLAKSHVPPPTSWCRPTPPSKSEVKSFDLSIRPPPLLLMGSLIVLFLSNRVYAPMVSKASFVMPLSLKRPRSLFRCLFLPRLVIRNLSFQ